MSLPMRLVDIPMTWGITGGATARSNVAGAAPSLELAVLAAPSVEPDVRRTAISGRLARHTRPGSRQGAAACFRDFVTAFHAVCLSRAGR